MNFGDVSAIVSAALHCKNHPIKWPWKVLFNSKHFELRVCLSWKTCTCFQSNYSLQFLEKKNVLWKYLLKAEIWLTTWDVKKTIKNGINYQPAGFIFHQQYENIISIYHTHSSQPSMLQLHASQKEAIIVIVVTRRHIALSQPLPFTILHQCTSWNHFFLGSLILISWFWHFHPTELGRMKHPWLWHIPIYNQGVFQTSVFQNLQWIREIGVHPNPLFQKINTTTQ